MCLVLEFVFDVLMIQEQLLREEELLIVASYQEWGARMMNSKNDS